MSENPGTEKVEYFLKEINNGSYVIPYFQRGFEWKAGMVCDLIESVLQDYYAGLLLFWDLNRKEAENEKWDPIWGAQLGNQPPERAVLDGQQRLSSLYYSIYLDFVRLIRNTT